MTACGEVLDLEDSGKGGRAEDTNEVWRSLDPKAAGDEVSKVRGHEGADLWHANRAVDGPTNRAVISLTSLTNRNEPEGVMSYVKVGPSASSSSRTGAEASV